MGDRPVAGGSRNMEKDQGTGNGKKETAFNEWDRIYATAKEDPQKREPVTVKKPICFRALSVGTPAAPECSECDCRELCIRTDTMGRPVPKK